jgi:hypothetical protein
MTLHSFQPAVRTLMGPGPADVHPRVLAALSRPTIGHLDPQFVGMMDELKDLLRYAFRTANRLTMPVSAPGSAGMETCFVNLVEPGDKVVVCINGVFGHRMKSNVERIGGTPVVVESPWGRAVDPQRLEDTLKANPDARIVAFVHAETSTGACSDVEDPGGDRPPPRLPDHRRLGHRARRLTAGGGRLGGGRGLRRLAEVPVLHPRARPGELQRARPGEGQASAGPRCRAGSWTSTW